MSRLASIGIPVSTHEELIELVKRVMPSTTRLRCRHGAYLVWASHSGAELWLHQDKSGTIEGLTPFFRGKGIVRVAPMRYVERKADNAFEGALHAWADPDDSQPDSGAYPFVFDVANIGLLGRRTLPAIGGVQISAFASEMRAFDSEQSYDRTQPSDVAFAAESFIPAGLFTPQGDDTSPPESTAIFTGRVLEWKTLENPLMEKQFIWALVQTLGGRYDVVAAPEIVEGSLVTGGIVTGTFWLCGLLPRAKAGVIQRIIGRWT